MSHDHKFPGKTPEIKTDGRYNHGDIAAAFEHSTLAQQLIAGTPAEPAMPEVEGPVELHSAVHRRDLLAHPSSIGETWAHNHPEDARGGRVQPRSITPDGIKNDSGKGSERGA